MASFFMKKYVSVLVGRGKCGVDVGKLLLLGSSVCKNAFVGSVGKME